MAESAAQRAARIVAARDTAEVEARRERQRRDSTIRVTPTARGNSDVDKRMGRTARQPR